MFNFIINEIYFLRYIIISSENENNKNINNRFRKSCELI